MSLVRVGAFGALVLGLAAGGGIASCSLFVSTDGLNDDATDAAIDAQVIEAAPSDASDPRDAGAEAAPVDSGVDANRPTTPPVFRSNDIASNSGNPNQVAITPSAKIQPGDYMIAMVYEYQFSSTASPPDASWVQIATFGEAGPSYQVYYYAKFAGSAEPATYTFNTLAGGDYASVMLSSFSGVSPTSPLDQKATVIYDSKTAFVAPAITTTSPNTLIVVSGVADGQSSSVWALTVGVSPRRTSGYVFAGDLAQADPGAAESITANCSQASNGGVASFALAPQ